MLRSLPVYLTTKCTKKENHKVHKDFQYSTCKNLVVFLVSKNTKYISGGTSE